jgi:hypothetical protein
MHGFDCHRPNGTALQPLARASNVSHFPAVPGACRRNASGRRCKELLGRRAKMTNEHYPDRGFRDDGPLAWISQTRPTFIL